MSEYVEVFGRALLSFLILFTLARILGKKQISHLTFFDYVVGIVIGDMASTMAIDTTMEILNGVIGLVVYTLLSLLIAFGAIKSFKFRDLVESSPSILIKDGKIMEKNLAKHRLTFDDLMNGLREKDAFNISEVELALLETNGQISVMKKNEYRSVTPKDLGISVEDDHAPSLIIVDGTLLEKRLQYLGFSKEWIIQEIKKQGGNKIEDVFIAQIDSSGSVYVDLFDDNEKVQQVQQKPDIASKLRKIQIALESTASKATDTNAKKMYYNQSIEIDHIIKRINPYLKETSN